jgi:hypothetical protein
MRDVKAPRRASIHCNSENYSIHNSQFTIHNSQLSRIIPSFLHSASLPLAQPFTDHTEQALCSAKKRKKKGQSRELGIKYSKQLAPPSVADLNELGINSTNKEMRLVFMNRGDGAHHLAVGPKPAIRSRART